MDIISKKHYMGFRFEMKLKDRIGKYCSKNGLSLNRLVERSVQFASGQHAKKRIQLKRSVSGFLKRVLLRDKISTVLTLTPAVHELIRSFSIIYRISRAEVIRIALELYLDWQEKDSRIDHIKHYYRVKQDIIKFVVITSIPQYPFPNPPNP